MNYTVGRITQLTTEERLGVKNLPTVQEIRNTGKITLDFKNSELMHEIIEVLQHIEHTTTCEATRKYLQDQLDYLTKP